MYWSESSFIGLPPKHETRGGVYVVGVGAVRRRRFPRKVNTVLSFPCRNCLATATARTAILQRNKIDFVPVYVRLSASVRLPFKWLLSLSLSEHELFPVFLLDRRQWAFLSVGFLFPSVSETPVDLLSDNSVH